MGPDAWTAMGKTDKEVAAMAAGDKLEMRTKQVLGVCVQADCCSMFSQVWTFTWWVLVLELHWAQQIRRWQLWHLEAS